MATHLPAAELAPASSWCERWSAGRHSWRHRSEGGFDPRPFSVEPLDEAPAKRFVTTHHYSGTYPASSRRYGLFSAGQLAGVAVFGIPVLRIYPRNNQKTAIQFMDYVLEKLPSGSSASRPTTAPSSKWLPLVPPRPRRRPRLHQASDPRLNGKVERSHRIDAEEFYRMLDGVVIDDTQLFNDKLQEWEDSYNFHRPHGGLDGQTPYERLRQKTATPPA